MPPKGISIGHIDVVAGPIGLNPDIPTKTEKLVSRLRAEYLELCDKLARLQVALITLAHDDDVTPAARDLLKGQKRAMDAYATILLARIDCALAEQDNQ